MKKTFTLNIAEPCSEDFSKMIKNQIGSHCELCNKTVLDFTRKTSREIASEIAKQKDKTSICAKVSPTQLQQEYSYNNNANYINLKYAMLFGATILGTMASYSQEKSPIISQTDTTIVHQNFVLGKIAMPQKQQLVKVIIFGIIKDSKTKNVLEKTSLESLKLFYNGIEIPIGIDLKTGKFKLEVEIDANATSLIFYSDFKGFSNYIEFKITKEEIETGKISQTIFIDTTRKFHEQIMGGLGINYIDEKVLSGIKV